MDIVLSKNGVKYTVFKISDVQNIFTYKEINPQKKLIMIKLKYNRIKTQEFFHP